VTRVIRVCRDGLGLTAKKVSAAKKVYAVKRVSVEILANPA